MIVCLSVHLARSAERVVSDFCAIDYSDQFWINPMEGEELSDASQEASSSSLVDGIEAHRMLWFRSRRISLLAGGE